MDRRLHNNLTALAVSGAVLVLALVSASPLPGDTQADLELTATKDAAHALLAVLEQRADGTDARTQRRISMPYFTFLPRG